MTYHSPTSEERAFLRLVTRGYASLEHQIDTCEISDYDLLGYYRVRIIDRESSQPRLPNPIHGPAIDFTKFHAPAVETAPHTDMPTYLISTEPKTTPVRVPYIAPDDPKLYFLGILLWTDAHGYFEAVEVHWAGDCYPVDPCRAYLDVFAAYPEQLSW